MITTENQKIEFASRVNALAGGFSLYHARVIREIAYYADSCHSGQFRKKNGEPYVFHVLRVAETVNSLTEDMNFGERRRGEMICTALLHDVIEDCGITEDDLRRFLHDNVLCGHVFSTLVSGMVNDLSEVKTEGNRAVRVKNEHDRLVSVLDIYTLIVKLADVMNNCIDISVQDMQFASQYLKEKIDFINLVSQRFDSFDTFYIGKEKDHEILVKTFMRTVLRMLQQQKEAIANVKT